MSCAMRLRCVPGAGQVIERTSMEIPGKRVVFERDGIRIVFSVEEFVAAVESYLEEQCRLNRMCRERFPTFEAEEIAFLEALKGADPMLEEILVNDLMDSKGKPVDDDDIDHHLADLLEKAGFMVIDRMGNRYSTVLWESIGGQRLFFLPDCTMFFRIKDWIEKPLQ